MLTDRIKRDVKVAGWALVMLVGLVFAVTGPVGAADDVQPAGGTEAVQPAAGEDTERMVSIDFNDVDLTVFIQFISELTGKNFVVDENVKGKITIVSPSKVTVEEAYQVFESVLEVHGYTTSPPRSRRSAPPSLPTPARCTSGSFGCSPTAARTPRPTSRLRATS